MQDTEIYSIYSRGRMILCTWFTFNRFLYIYVYLCELLVSLCLLTHHTPTFKHLFICAAVSLVLPNMRHTLTTRGDCGWVACFIEIFFTQLEAENISPVSSHVVQHANLAVSCKKRKEKRKAVSWENILYTSPTWTSLINSLFLTDLTNMACCIFIFVYAFLPFFTKWDHQKKIIIHRKKQQLELHAQGVHYLCHQAQITKLPSVIIISDQMVSRGFVQPARL